MEAKPMGPVEAVAQYYKNYAVFSGRARRAEYWWPMLLFVIVYFVAVALIEMVADPEVQALAALIFLGFLILSILPSVAVVVRRLHDMNYSGWIILAFLIPIAGPIAQLVMMTSRGTLGPNRFGPDPLTLGPITQHFEQMHPGLPEPSGYPQAAFPSHVVPPQPSVAESYLSATTPPKAGPPQPPPSPLAGWYPAGPNEMRWWDGSRWTDHIYPTNPEA